MSRFPSEITAEMAEVRRAIAARENGTPNLRDFYGRPVDAEGRDDYGQYQAAIAAYHAETDALAERLQALGYERNTAIALARDESVS